MYLHMAEFAPVCRSCAIAMSTSMSTISPAVFPCPPFPPPSAPNAALMRFAASFWRTSAATTSTSQYTPPSGVSLPCTCSRAKPSRCTLLLSMTANSPSPPPPPSLPPPPCCVSPLRTAPTGCGHPTLNLPRLASPTLCASSRCSWLHTRVQSHPGSMLQQLQQLQQGPCC